MTKLPDPNDIFAPVPASYPFEEQLEDNKARLEEVQAENPLPEPFAQTIGSVAPTGQVAPTATSEETKTGNSIKQAKTSKG